MQNLVPWIEKERAQTPPPTSLQLLNRMREYLQILVLKSIYHSKWGRALSFLGGTCLRICYDLKRFSEDLDFTLDRKEAGYSFGALVKTVQRDFEREGYKVEWTPVKEDIVQKVFFKFDGLLYPLGLSTRKNEKFRIKLEVDNNPIPVEDNQRESFFVAKMNEVFPILKHRLETLFAGKILALLSRVYTKGRDYYDLIWYLTQKTPIDMRYLEAGVVQANRSSRTEPPLPHFKTPKDVLQALTKKIERMDKALVLGDLHRFLEDPTEEVWIKEYPRLFAQLKASYLTGSKTP